MRTQSQHSRLKKRVRTLTEEIQSLRAPTELHAVPTPSSIPSVAGQSTNGLEGLLDKALDLTKGWEKIASLVALVTTNLSGNKSLGALLEILAKDKTFPAANEGNTIAGTSLNISDLLGMAESILKTGQLPLGLAAAGAGSQELVEVQPEAEVIAATADISEEIVEGEAIESPVSEHVAEVLESINSSMDESDEAQIELAQ